jgi:hypothetical protein
MPVLHKLLLKIAGPELHNHLVEKYPLTPRTTIILVMPDEQHYYHVPPVSKAMKTQAYEGTMESITLRYGGMRYADYQIEHDILFLEP